MTHQRGIVGYACSKCGWSDIIQVSACPTCRSSVKETQFSKHGTISTFTIIRYPPRGFEKKLPYAVAIVQLEKGPKVMGRVIVNPKKVQIGDPVTFARMERGAPVFKSKH